jgi:hypothetical protein
LAKFPFSVCDSGNFCQRTGDEAEDISGRELEKLDIRFGADVLSTQSIKAPDVVNGINESIVKKRMKIAVPVSQRKEFESLKKKKKRCWLM